MKHLLNIVLIVFLLSISIYAQTTAEFASKDTTRSTVEDNNCLKLLDAAERNDKKAFQEILPTHADVNAVQECGLTGLMIVTMAGHLEFAKELILRGADVDISDENGKTALMYAAEFGSLSLVKLLLGAGADPNAKTKKRGLTALWFVLDSVYSQWDEYEEIADLLKTFGAKIE